MKGVKYVKTKYKACLVKTKTAKMLMLIFWMNVNGQGGKYLDIILLL